MAEAASHRLPSQPVYPPLAWDPQGVRHLLLACGDEPATTEALARRLAADAPADLALIQVGAGPWARLLPTASASTAPDAEAALDLLQSRLAEARMGLRLYLLGPESLLWRASRLAAAAGLGEDAIRRERFGTLARPVWCVHCQQLHGAVRSNLLSCQGCGRTLLVRDHFSRRLGAYMGVQVDAEVPGEHPPPEILYP